MAWRLGIDSINGSLLEHSELVGFGAVQIDTSVLLTNVRTADGLLPMNASRVDASSITGIGTLFNEKTTLLALNPQPYGDSVYASVTSVLPGSNLKAYELLNQYANYLGGSITVINDQQEMDNVSHYVDANATSPSIFDGVDCGSYGCAHYFDRYWGFIGLTDFDEDGRYDWVDGSAFAYQPATFNMRHKFVYLERNGWSSAWFMGSVVFELPSTIDTEHLNSQPMDFLQQKFTSHNAFLNRWWDESAHWQTFASSNSYSNGLGEFFAHLPITIGGLITSI